MQVSPCAISQNKPNSPCALGFRFTDGFRLTISRLQFTIMPPGVGVLWADYGELLRL